MKVFVDRERCQGHAICYITTPAVFVLDDDGYAEASGEEVPDELVESVRRSAAGCPEQAIRLTEDGRGSGDG